MVVEVGIKTRRGKGREKGRREGKRGFKKMTEKELKGGGGYRDIKGENVTM